MSKYVNKEQVVKEIEDWADGFEESPGYFSGKQVAAVVQNCVDIILNADSIKINTPQNCKECLLSGLRSAIKCKEWDTLSAGLREVIRSNTCPFPNEEVEE